MLNKLFVGFFCTMLCVSACRSVGEDTADLIIVPGYRVGSITGRSSLESLVETYGADQVRKENIYIAEGTYRQGLTLFPGRPRELEVVLDEKGAPEFARITREETPWQTKEGITIGLSLEKLQEINHSPFLFYGFEWDYGGLVTSWEDGQLPAHLIVALAPADPDPLPEGLLGEVQLSSEDEFVRQRAFEVGSMVITFKK